MNKYLNAFKKRKADHYVAHSARVPSSVKQVSFTFDDVPSSAFDLAQPILDAQQYKGTFYLSLSFLEADEENEDLFNSEQLAGCIANGHEVACHTYHHIHFYQHSDPQFIENNIRRNQEKLHSLGIQRSFENFSYPFGEQTKKAKRIVSKKFRTARSIEHGINRDRIDLHNLKSVRLYEQLHSLDTIFSILEDVNRSGGWLIFYTHDVQSDFSKYGCSPEYFEKVVHKCKDLGVYVKTVAAGVESLI